MVRYYDHIRSKLWREVIAPAARKRAGYRCERKGCGKSDCYLEVHHKNYRNLGHERPEDLETLCEQCHATTHGTWSLALGRRTRYEERVQFRQSMPLLQTRPLLDIIQKSEIVDIRDIGKRIESNQQQIKEITARLDEIFNDLDELDRQLRSLDVA